MEVKQFTENTLTVVLGDEISEDLNRQLVNLKHRILQESIEGIEEVIVSYTALVIYFNVMEIEAKDLIETLQAIKGSEFNQKVNRYKVFEIPVCYGGEYGPDVNLFEENGLGLEEIINLHSEKEYLVYMVGFMPGFPYLGGLDERLFKDRLDNPRTNIPAGSVGIGGKQTGMYPFESPGGWNLIGRTPIKLYDERRGEDAVLYQAGDRIVYKAISEEEFKEIEEQVEMGTYKVPSEVRGETNDTEGS